MADVIDNEAVLDATEKALEVIEDQLDGVVDVVEVVRNNPKVLVAVGVVGIAVGAGLGYFIATKRLAKHFDEQMKLELEQTKRFYANLNKVDEDGAILTPQQVMEKLHGSEVTDALRTYQGDISPAEDDLEAALDSQDDAQIARIEERVRHGQVSDEKVVVTEKTEVINVFDDSTFDYEEEKKYRTPTEPYVITHDEYFEGEKEYENSSLTYYEVDDTLVDEMDKPVVDIESFIGEDNLVRFGHGSRDKNIVYVRNEKVEMDFEIAKSNGSYLEEVLGFIDNEPNSLKHSGQRDLRRAFRHGED